MASQPTTKLGTPISLKRDDPWVAEVEYIGQLIST